MREVFPRLLGNEGTKRRIGDAILSGRLPHALLIDGGRGSGKLTLAKSIAAALGCENRDNARHTLPCHACPCCAKIFGDGHVDVHVVGAEDGRATIGVEQIKELRRDMFLTATESEHKVYIIRDAEKMTPAAQNALLIVLEEPPKGVVIMLLASGSDKILTTIKSRAQYLPMSRFSPEELAEHIKSIDPEARRVAAADPEGFASVLTAADGRIGLAAELVSPSRREALREEREETLSVMSALGRGKGFGDVYAAVTALPSKRPELALSLERIMLALSDLIRLRYDQDSAMRFFTGADEAEKYSAGFTAKKLFRLYDIINAAYDANTKNANTSMLLTALAADLAGA